MGNSPPAPSAPLKNALLSNSTSMYIYWSAVTTSDLIIKGYVLLMDDGLQGDYSEIYNGRLNPESLHYIVNGLIKGRFYNFKVKATDINGDGDESTVSTF